MIKYFCDNPNCSRELIKGEGQRYVAEKNGLKVEVRFVMPNEWDADKPEPVYCRYCLLDIALVLDDRPTTKED